MRMSNDSSDGYRRRVGDAGVKLVKEFEELRLEVYKCPAGVLTVGWGHTGKDVDSLGLGGRINQNAATKFLLDDLQEAEELVCRSLPEKILRLLPQESFDALISFTFNTGKAAGTTLFRHVAKGEFALAAAQFPMWVYAKGRKLNGLVRRREMERQLFLSGLAKLKGENQDGQTT